MFEWGQSFQILHIAGYHAWRRQNFPTFSIRLKVEGVTIHFITIYGAFYNENSQIWALQVERMKKSNVREIAFKVDLVFRLDFKNWDHDLRKSLSALRSFRMLSKEIDSPYFWIKTFPRYDKFCSSSLEKCLSLCSKRYIGIVNFHTVHTTMAKHCDGI